MLNRLLREITKRIWHQQKIVEHRKRQCEIIFTLFYIQFFLLHLKIIKIYVIEMSHIISEIELSSSFLFVFFINDIRIFLIRKCASVFLHFFWRMYLLSLLIFYIHYFYLLFFTSNGILFSKNFDMSYLYNI